MIAHICSSSAKPLRCVLAPYDRFQGSTYHTKTGIADDNHVLKTTTGRKPTLEHVCVQGVLNPSIVVAADQLVDITVEIVP